MSAPPVPAAPPAPPKPPVQKPPVAPKPAAPAIPEAKAPATPEPPKPPVQPAGEPMTYAPPPKPLTVEEVEGPATPDEEVPPPAPAPPRQQLVVEPPKPAPAPPPPAPAPAPKVEPPAPAPAPQPAPAPEKKDGGGFNPGKIVDKAKEHASNAIEWAKGHPWQAAGIGAGVAIGTAVIGWLVFKALKGGKAKGKGKGKHGKRSVEDFHADIMEEFPTNKLERRAVLDEIDWEDEEFVEFLQTLPQIEDILQEGYY